jgi:L-asparaginase
MSKPFSDNIKPRIIIHGGAGNITPENITPDKLAQYRASLLGILASAHSYLHSTPAPSALDVAVYAVSQFEDDPLFNCSKGAVFTRSGTNELEASVMVSDPKTATKRGAGCMLISTVKNPIKLAKEILLRREETNGHCQLSGPEAEKLAKTWGLDIVDPGYYWTKERWEQHKRGLGKEKTQQSMSEKSRKLEGDATWDPREYYPQGTVGAVVLDANGMIAVATSTGGLTNKLAGRIGDTPTLGAGFWAEEWTENISMAQSSIPMHIVDSISRGNLLSAIQDCFPLPWNHDNDPKFHSPLDTKPKQVRHAVGLSGTGNGDSFLRLSAARTIAAISRFSSPNVSLAKAITQVAGPGGELEQSAGDRWGHTGEGEAGVIGIELVDSQGIVSFDYNKGMFRAFIDDDGKAVWGAFRDAD